MKVVINACFGGFSLSPVAIKRLAELQGRECYFFVNPRADPHKMVPATIEEASKGIVFYAYDMTDISSLQYSKPWHEMTMAERQRCNEEDRKHSIDNRDMKRDDPNLVRLVEELGEKANGSHAQLKIVEIPDGLEWTIEEYDGNEHIAEAHRTWR